MSSDKSIDTTSEDFISQVCDAFKKAVESASGVMLEGREREFRRQLTEHLFDKILGWKGYSKTGEIFDIWCLDDENFPIILIETKWGVEPTRKIKEKLRKRIEELGSVKYGVFASERDFIVYEYADYKLKEITKINVAEAIGVARGEYGLSEIGKRRVLELEMLKRERLVWVEEPDYFEKTYKEISVERGEGVELLTENLRVIVRDLTAVLMNFFDSYQKRKEHYSGRFLEKTFDDWLKLSMKGEEFKERDETSRKNIIEIFCRETAYVLLGRVLFTRMCEDKGIMKNMISGKGIVESLRYYGKRRTENVYLYLFNESREEIKKYYSHLHELGFFDWWLIEEIQRGTLSYDYRKNQDNLEKDLDYSVKKALRRLNRFDFAQVNRDILGDVYQGYLPSDERKRLGEFYTPKEVIEYILDAVGYKPDKEIRGKKILDPACGSGGFLVEAIQRLTERYGRIGFSLKNPDDAQQIVNGCINSIHGLDIHPFACFIAEMNLLFQLVDLYDVVRQKYRYYELPRLNIYRTDSLAPSGGSIELTEFFDNSRRKMLIEETKGADKIKIFKFDYVVGNPPYVKSKSIPDDYWNYLKTSFRTAYKKFDLYVPFIELGINLLKENGKLSFIVSNKFMVSKYGLKLREFILNHCAIERIVDVSNISVFLESSPYPCIIVLRKEQNTEVRNKTKLEAIIGINTPDDFLEKAGLTLNVPQNIFTKIDDKIFSLSLSEDMVSIINKIEEDSVKLGQICTVRKGIHTGNVKSKLVKGKKISEKCKKLLDGSNVRRYQVKWDGKWIVYDDALINKDKGEYGSLRDERIFSCDEKLILRLFAKRPTGVYDDSIFYCLNSLSVVLQEDKKYNLKYALACLNSTLMFFYYKTFFGPTHVRGRYFQFYTSDLEQLPIKKVTDVNKPLRKQLIHIVDQIQHLLKESQSFERNIEDFPESYFEDGWSFDKLMNVIKTQSLSYPAYTISEKPLRTDYRQRDLDGSETFRIILAPNEFIDFYHEEVASYVFEVLKNMNRITKRELLELKIPQQPHLKNLLNQYRKDKEQIVKNEKAVKELEKQIDDLVYKLYDITYKERRTIEEYLAKF